MRVAREGLPFVIGSELVLAALAVSAAMRGSVLLWVVAGLWTIISLWVIYFFRDPERDGPRGDALVISPADGKIVSVVEVDEPGFIRGRAMRVSVFMNIFSVHVNRYPVSGEVRWLHYNPGRFLNAAAEKANLENEQMSVGIVSPIGRVVVRQIAGLIARRIVTYSREGDQAAQGARYGLIRFGSRVDVFVPTDCRVQVQVGDQVQAGLTVLAQR
ncbi:MAG: phosphatidylserine decarboxylase family protein [Gemmatimonadetes bacterium]|nr:phosphatidylserine decarboxylase family protein [Gemmatimonadota bacterium]